MLNISEAIKPSLESELASELQNHLFWNVTGANSLMDEAITRNASYSVTEASRVINSSATLKGLRRPGSGHQGEARVGLRHQWKGGTPPRPTGPQSQRSPEVPAVLIFPEVKTRILSESLTVIQSNLNYF